MDKKRMTPKMERFAQSIGRKEFDYDWLAYKAHYDTANMSQNAIYVETCKLRQNPKVSLRIQEIEDEIRQNSIATLEEIMNAMTIRVRLDLRELFNEDGSFKNIHDLTKEQASLLSEFNVEEIWAGRGEHREQVGLLKRVKLVSLDSVWDKFLKRFGAYLNKVEIESKDLDYLKDLVDKIKT